MAENPVCYQFGAGRCILGQGVLEKAGEEIARWGRKAYVIAGPTAMAVARPRLTRGLQAAGLRCVLDVHPGHVCHDAARRKADYARQMGCDVVVGVGGGRMMDFSKLCAWYLGTRVVNVPTSASTCAAYTPFSLVYTEQGQTIAGNFCYEREVAAVLMDLDVLAAQPQRLLASGMLDALSKLPEITNGSSVLGESAAPLDLFAAYTLTGLTHARLNALADGAVADGGAGLVSQALQDAVFMNIPLTGIISALSRGVGQSAIAHELYYQARFLYTDLALHALHGEIVGVGMIMQYHYNGTPERVQPHIRLLERLGAPACLSQIGIPPTAEHCARLEDAIAATAFVGKDAASRKRFSDAFALIAR